MAQLWVKIHRADNMYDKAPAPGCCGERIESKPLLYFTLESTAGIWATDANKIEAGKVTWMQEFTHIKCRDPESDRLSMYVVDGAHWRPDNQCKPGHLNDNPPEQHFYGRYRMSVIQFERAKSEVQTLVAQTMDGKDTTVSFTVEGMFLDSNIDDHRTDRKPSVPPGQEAPLPGVPAPGPPPAAMVPPPQPYVPPPGPPVAPAPVVWSALTSGTYTPYAQQDSDAIEALYQRNGGTGVSPPIVLSFAPMSYQFDFMTMEQKNATSGKARKIQRSGGYPVAAHPV